MYTLSKNPFFRVNPTWAGSVSSYRTWMLGVLNGRLADEAESNFHGGSELTAATVNFGWDRYYRLEEASDPSRENHSEKFFMSNLLNLTNSPEVIYKLDIP